MSPYSYPDPNVLEKSLQMVEENDLIVLVGPTIKLLTNINASEMYSNFYRQLVHENKDFIVFYNSKKQFDDKVILFKKSNRMISWVTDWKSKYNQLVDIHTFFNVWNHQLQLKSALRIVDSIEFSKCFGLKIKN